MVALVAVLKADLRGFVRAMRPVAAIDVRFESLWHVTAAMLGATAGSEGLLVASTRLFSHLPLCQLREVWRRSARAFRYRYRLNVQEHYASTYVHIHVKSASSCSSSCRPFFFIHISVQRGVGMMALNLLKRPNARLFLALMSFLGSISILGFMFRDSFPNVTIVLTAEDRELKAKEKAKAEALKIWHTYNASLDHDSAGHDPTNGPPWGHVVIAGQETTDMSWADRLADG